jgi:ubiquinone/menaquinone biosynthesis C-methylase UbiE
MADPFAQFATRLAYGATQLPRVAWYLGQGMLVRQISRSAAQKAQHSNGRPMRSDVLIPERRPIYDHMAALLREDLANVEAGIYPLPADHDGSILNLLDRSRLFFTDLPKVYRRRQQRQRHEVRNNATIGKRPAYYLQNFHFQSGGWMTEDSARRYDTQVEILFKGTANAMRRQALPPLYELFRARDQRSLRFLDVGCGTGRFLDFFKQSWPRMPALGLDLSEPYLAEAKRHLGRWCWLDLIVANAETIPLSDASQDAVTCIFTFHELPPQVRRAFFREFARVLRPGGRFVLIDSLQLGDEPDYDGMLQSFPRNFHEPYYASYLKEDFAAIAANCGLRHVGDTKAFVSKVLVFDKPR